MNASQPSKTIATVFDEFLKEQKARLSPKTFSQYRSIIDLYGAYLERYWPGHDGEYEGVTETGGSYCGTFGPESIPYGFSEFLGYFMPRKVVAGNETMKAAGTVTKKLSKWLVEKGYVEKDRFADETIRTRAKDLPDTQRLLDLLIECVEGQPRGSIKQREEGHFEISRIEPGRIWLKSLFEKDEIGPIRVPPEISAQCREGWDIGGEVARTARGWHLVDIWNVSP